MEFIDPMKLGNQVVLLKICLNLQYLYKSVKFLLIYICFFKNHFPPSGKMYLFAQAFRFFASVQKNRTKSTGECGDVGLDNAPSAASSARRPGMTWRHNGQVGLVVSHRSMQS